MVAAGRRHGADKLLVAVARRFAAEHYRPIAHHRHMAGKLANFRQFVRDKDDPHAEPLQRPDLLKQPFRFARR